MNKFVNGLIGWSVANETKWINVSIYSEKMYTAHTRQQWCKEEKKSAVHARSTHKQTDHIFAHTHTRSRSINRLEEKRNRWLSNVIYRFFFHARFYSRRVYSSKKWKKKKNRCNLQTKRWLTISSIEHIKCYNRLQLDSE